MDAVEVLVQRVREQAIADGRVLTALLDIADAARTGFDADEIAFALAWTHGGARSRLSYARYLRDVIPAVFTALCAGEVDGHRSWVFYDVLATADDQVAATVVDAGVAACARVDDRPVAASAAAGVMRRRSGRCHRAHPPRYRRALRRDQCRQ